MHHELCFGCGQTNLFGLLMDADRAEDGRLSGRWFVKQDHQGPDRGMAHPGIVASALIEAAMLAGGDGVQLEQIELELGSGPGPAVGSFCAALLAIVNTSLLDSGGSHRLLSSSSVW